MVASSFTEQGAFDPEATGAMGEAFDAACAELDCATQPEVVRDLIAGLIIAAACRGEFHPVRLPATMPMHPFGAFGPEAIVEITAVLDLAFEELENTGEPDAVRERAPHELL
jgi:hypothetical protein